MQNFFQGNKLERFIIISSRISSTEGATDLDMNKFPPLGVTVVTTNDTITVTNQTVTVGNNNSDNSEENNGGGDEE